MEKLYSTTKKRSNNYGKNLMRPTAQNIFFSYKWLRKYLSQRTAKNILVNLIQDVLS